MSTKIRITKKEGDQLPSTPYEEPPSPRACGIKTYDENKEKDHAQHGKYQTAIIRAVASEEEAHRKQALELSPLGIRPKTPDDTRKDLQIISATTESALIICAAIAARVMYCYHDWCFRTSISHAPGHELVSTPTP